MITFKGLAKFAEFNAAFLALCAMVNIASAEPALPDGVASGGSNGYCFVTYEGKVFANGSYALGGDSGFVKCAIAPTFGACGLKGDGSLTCENGYSRTGVQSVYGRNDNGFGAQVDLIDVVTVSGNWESVLPNGTVKYSASSGNVTDAHAAGYVPDSYVRDVCYVDGGTAVMVRLGAPYNWIGYVSNAVSCALAGQSQEAFYALKTDGTIGVWADGWSPYVPSGTFSVMASHGTYGNIAIGTDDIAVVWNTSGLMTANVPSFAVRDPVTYSYAGTSYFCAVRKSDNVFGCWNSSTAFTAASTISANDPNAPPETCQDGIKNQNETDVDVGGICGGYDAFTGPNGSVCKNDTYVDPYTGTYEPAVGFFSGSWDAYQDDANSYVKIQTSGSDWDVLESFGLDMSGSYLNVDTFKSLDAGTGSEFVMNKLASYTGRNQMFLRSVRDGNVRPVNYVRFAIPENRGFEGWELGWVNFLGANGQTQTDTLRVLSGAVDGHFYAFAQAPDGFTATRGITVQWDLDAFSSSFVFDGFEMGVTTGYTVTKASCGNGDYYCEVLEDSNGNFSCSAKAGELGGINSCAWYSSGTVCAPTVPIGDPTTVFPPSPGTSSGTGAAGGNSSSGSLGGFSSFSGTFFNYQFGILPEASGSCAEVFDASGRFKYVKSSTDFSMSLPKRLDFSKERWTCPILSSDLCGVAWDAADFTVNKVFVASANGISDFVTSPLKGAVAYMGTPKNGGTYCFLGSSVTYGGKPESYVSYLGGKHTESTAGRTAWDWFFIMLLIASMTYYLFRKA